MQLAPAAADEGVAPEAAWLASLRTRFDAPPADVTQALHDWLAAPPPADRALHTLVQGLALAPIETLAVAVALAVDTDPLAARAVGWLQSPLRDLHPTAGFIAALQAAAGRSSAQALAELLDGTAVRCGLLQVQSQGRTLPDAVLSVPAPIVMAASGAEGHWPGVRLETGEGAPWPPSVQDDARRWSAALAAGSRVLVVRAAHLEEARAAAAAVAQGLGRCAACVEGAPPAGLAPWLLLRGALPVFCAELAPGERQRVPALPGHAGPVLVATGTDGAWTWDGEAPPAWRVPRPRAGERTALWRAAGAAPALADALGAEQLHSAARIQRLARDAHAERLRCGEGELTLGHVHRAARQAAGELGTLAEHLPEDVPDEALVLPRDLRAELERVLARCRQRDGLADGLGPAARARYHPGVRVLMVGASGTGKTLTAGWIATRLGLPLYRVDLAAVTSKYIGETEKNLAELFARAEHAGAVLLFDEADALFGKRTEVKDANDRFANQQTNYLLQRIESFDGIVVLTSNSRSRFDSAFTRRLDAVLEFPAPAAEERRALWLAHLGEAHALDAAGLNRLAAGCELTGGHVRNVVLAARALAPQGRIGWPELARALAAEYRKLAKPMPGALAEPARAGG